ncbi:hypothetical protein LguiA_028917 [Lonicera macranthoides]
MWVGDTLSDPFWREGMNGRGWASCTIGVIVLVFVCQLVLVTATRFRFSFFSFFFSSRRRINNTSSSHVSPPPPLQLNNPPTVSRSPLSHHDHGISSLISNFDLKILIDNLDEKLQENEKWDNVIDRSNNLIFYSAKCCKPKNSPLRYLSVTVFEDCNAETLRDFYMDNDYRKQWDKTLIEHEQLRVDESNGTEIGRTIKKFPLLTPREYVLAWRLWDGNDGTYYCFSKECEHPLAPKQKKYVRVRFLRSGWRIRKVPGRNACEIKMVHQEDAGLNVEMAKLAFAKGIWSFVCKMDDALRKYSAISWLQSTSALNAITLIQKVPPGLDTISRSGTSHPEISGICSQDVPCEYGGEDEEGKLARRPSGKMIANGLIVLGGVICLSRGHSNLGAKVAMAYILSKLTKHRAGPLSSQSARASIHDSNE